MGTYGKMGQKTAVPFTTAAASNCTNILSDTISCTGPPPVSGSHSFDYEAACVFNYPKPSALSLAQQNRGCQARWPGTSYHVDQYASIYGAYCR